MMLSMHPVAHRIGRVLAIRPGEGRLVVRVAALFAVVEAGRGLGEVGVDTLVLGSFGPQELPSVLPFLFIALGATGLVVAVIYSAALGRLPRRPLFIGLIVGLAGLIVAVRLALGTATGEAASLVPLLWLIVYVTGTLAVTIYWTVAGSAFDARQAKRLFPLLTAAAIAGSFVGNLGAGPVAHLVGAESLVVAEAMLLFVGAILLGQLPARPRRASRSERRPSVVQELRAGFDFVAASPLMRLVALAYLLLSVLMFSVSYPFYIVASDTFATDAEVATALGLLSAAVTATSFLVSIGLANRLYARFGVAVGAVILPFVYLVGFGLWIVQFSFATAAFVRFAQQVTQRGLSNAAWSAFYNVVPADRRAQVLAFNDGVPGQLGTILSGLLLLAAGRILAPDQVFWLGAATALVAGVVVVGIRRRYGGSLLRALRSGAGERVLEGGPGIAILAHDPSVARALIEALSAPEPGVREMAAVVLAQVTVPGSRDALITALGDEDARVRAAAIRALTNPGHGTAGVDLTALAIDPNPTVRAAAIVAQVGRGVPTERALLVDPSAEVRAAAIGVLSIDQDNEAAVLAAFDDDSAMVRQAAAIAVGASGVDPRHVIERLSDGTRRSQATALVALIPLGEHDPTVRATVAEWAHGRLTRAADLRVARAAITPSAPPIADVAGFLAFVLEARQLESEEAALGALAVLGAPEARGVIRRCLHSDDPEIRAQAMEALDSIGDRRLAGALLRQLEGDIESNASSADDTMRGLIHDADPWISTLARRRIHDVGGASDMAQTARSVSDLDTMLLLRRVPLFEGLDPEDLQRIASTSEEHAYAGGETVLREGDLGDELVVIVTGSVRVVRTEPDGSERVIRRYDAGEHIGELAVLRERPRAATVIAEAGGVRGLVISGEGLKAILRERPDAAMAMLATLAERIGRQ